MSALNERGAFSFMRSYWEVINDLSDEQAGELIKGLARYQFTGEKPKFKGVLNAVWKGFERLAESQVKGFLDSKKQTVRKQPLDTPPRGGVKGGLDAPPLAKNKEQRVKSKEVYTKKRFIKPTLDEVKAYCAERKNQVNPEKWFNHYEANGWKVGRNSMKDWKAAVRTWENSEFNKKDESGPNPKLL